MRINLKKYFNNKFYINVAYYSDKFLDLIIEPVQSNFQYKYYQRISNNKVYPRNYYICG